MFWLVTDQISDQLDWKGILYFFVSFLSLHLLLHLFLFYKNQYLIVMNSDDNKPTSVSYIT